VDIFTSVVSYGGGVQGQQYPHVAENLRKIEQIRDIMEKSLEKDREKYFETLQSAPKSVKFLKF